MKEFVENHDSHLHQAFKDFQTTHKKEYESEEEHSKRLNLFRQNMRQDFNCFCLFIFKSCFKNIIIKALFHFFFFYHLDLYIVIIDLEKSFNWGLITSQTGTIWRWELWGEINILQVLLTMGNPSHTLKRNWLKLRKTFRNPWIGD